MKLILHHLLKDIRAQRWLLLLWAFVLLVPLILNALVFQPDYDTAKYIETLRVSPLLLFINVIVWTILVARLIQSDPVTGTTSFWLTRPIPTWAYIPSKLLFLACLVILPGALSCLASDAQLQAATEMIRNHLLVFFVSQIIGGIAVIWLATYTPSLLHFAGMLCVGLLGLFLLALLNATLIRPHLANGTWTADHFIDIFVPGLFASLVVQHWQRRGRAGLIVGGAAIMLAVVAQVCLPPAPAVAPFVYTGEAAHIEISPDWQNHIFWGRRENSSEAMTVLKPVNDRDGGFVVQSVTGQFQAAGESPAPLALEPALPQTLRFQQQLKPLALVRNELPDYAITRGRYGQDGNTTVTLFSLDPAQKAQLRGKMGALVLKIQGRKLSLFQMAKIPLGQPHFIARIPGGFIRIKSLTPPDDQNLVVWRVSAEENISWMQDMIYVLVDPRNRTGTVLDQSGSSSSSNSLGGAFRTVDSETTLSVNGNGALDQMMLYVYEATQESPFEIMLTAPNFTMNPN